jgi:hypothetical protein
MTRLPCFTATSASIHVLSGATEMPSHLQDMLEQWRRRTRERQLSGLAASLAGRVALRFVYSSNQAADAETGP